MFKVQNHCVHNPHTQTSSLSSPMILVMATCHAKATHWFVHPTWIGLQPRDNVGQHSMPLVLCATLAALLLWRDDYPFGFTEEVSTNGLICQNPRPPLPTCLKRQATLLAMLASGDFVTVLRKEAYTPMMRASIVSSVLLVATTLPCARGSSATTTTSKTLLVMTFQFPFTNNEMLSKHQFTNQHLPNVIPKNRLIGLNNEQRKKNHFSSFSVT